MTLLCESLATASPCVSSRTDSTPGATEQQATVCDDSLGAAGLHIIEAKYGAFGTWIDVTKELSEQVRDNTLSIKACNAISDDPLYGVVKSLKVEYILDGRRKTVEVQEGRWLHIPPDVQRYPEVVPVDTHEQLMALLERCPAQVGLFAKNLSTGAELEYRADQPACLASIVKIFVLLEVMRQADTGKLDLSDSITLGYKDEKLLCTISGALDLMIGKSDNVATGALAELVGYARVNSLPSEFGITGLSDKILPEPGVLAEVLDKRVYGDRKPSILEVILGKRLFGGRVVFAPSLMPQHGTARGVTRFFKLLYERSLINESISERVLEVFDRNPKNFAPTATPVGFKSGGKGGSLSWKRPGCREFNMIGWGLLVRSKETALAFCLWCEWFPEHTSQDVQAKWCTTISDSIVKILLAQSPVPSES